MLFRIMRWALAYYVRSLIIPGSLHPAQASHGGARARRGILDGARPKTRDAGNVLMPKKGVTGHDEWVVTEALATAFVALEQLQPVHQPRTHMDEIRKLLTALCQPGTVNLHLAQAKCRLFPEVDREIIYREYGLEEREV
jgi:hypothetical protein